MGGSIFESRWALMFFDQDRWNSHHKRRYMYDQITIAENFSLISLSLSTKKSENRPYLRPEVTYQKSDSTLMNKLLFPKCRVYPSHGHHLIYWKQTCGPAALSWRCAFKPEILNLMWLGGIKNPLVASISSFVVDFVFFFFFLFVHINCLIMHMSRRKTPHIFKKKYSWWKRCPTPSKVTVNKRSFFRTYKRQIAKQCFIASLRYCIV